MNRILLSIVGVAAAIGMQSLLFAATLS